MPSEIYQVIEKSRGRLAWFEKRLEDLKVHLAGLPSVGCHRPEFLRTQRVIQFVKKAHEEERDQLEWLLREAKEEEEAEKKYGPAYKLTPEEEADFAEYMKAHAKRDQERRRREVEAEKRREQFRVIPGGR